MNSTKSIEAQAFEYLKQYVAINLPNATLEDARSKKRDSTAIGDAVLKYEGHTVHIEVKGSNGPKLPHNIRFTHQTVSATQGEHLIVAIVWNLGGEKPKIGFFNFSTIQKHILVEPHFIIQAKHLMKGKDLIEGVFFEHLNPMITPGDPVVDMLELFNTPVGNHVRKKLQHGTSSSQPNK